MRDPDRIPIYMARLAAIWKRYPDLRLGQLMCNILGHYSAEKGDPFFPEDEEFMQFCEELFRPREYI